VAGRGEDGIDAVAEAPLELIAVHAVLSLDVADDGLDSRTTLHLATGGSRDAVTRRTCREIQTLSRCGWLWPRYPLSTWVRHRA
jgi:hypothetical protein